jgi:mannose-6-phosphate isomerase-like protein (cupin superfamily)
MNAPLPAGNGLWFLNTHVTPAPAPAGMSIAEHLMPFGESPPVHVHHDEEEIFHIKAGTIRFRVGDEEFVAGPGETCVAPRGVPHSFRVESEKGARVLIITNGEGFDRMVREMARPATDLGLPEPAPVTPDLAERLAAACARNGIDIVGPPLAA